jgi:hypothetical protein
MADPRFIRNLKPKIVQVWTLVSLQPVHRAIVIRAVERIHASMSTKLVSAAAIEWRNVMIAPEQSSISKATGSLEDCSKDRSMDSVIVNVIDSNVLIVDRKALLTNASTWKNQGILQAKSSIRLLWSWGEQGYSDLSWCTEFGMDGNIFNVPSLERWCSIGVQRGTNSEQPSSPILSGFSLPKIPKTK